MNESDAPTESSATSADTLIAPARIDDVAPFDAIRAIHRERTRRSLLAAFIVGVAFDIATQHGLGTASGSLFAWSFVGAFAVIAQPRRRSARFALVAAATISGFLSLRTSAWILPLDVIAVMLLVLLAITFERRVVARPLGFVDLVEGWIYAIGTTLVAPVHLAIAAAMSAPRQHQRTRRRELAVGRGVAMALPVLVVVTALLASADGIFRSFLRSPLPGDQGFAHLAIVACGMCIGLVPLVRLRAEHATAPTTMTRRGGVEIATVLATLTAIYALFAVAQATALVRGDAYVQRTTRLTYAEYARSGYFQLLAVASITGLLLLAVRAIAPQLGAEGARVVRVLATTCAALTLLIIASALRRLALYDAAFGWTMLRLACMTFGLWMASVFCILAVAVASPRHGTHLAGLVVVSAFATLLAWNVMNPAAVVASHNLERGGDIDLHYVASLGDDATPLIIDRLGSLTDPQKSQLIDVVCRDAPRSPSVLSFNWSRERAADATRSICAR